MARPSSGDDVGGPQAPLDEPADGVLHVAVVEHLDRAAHPVGQRAGRPAGVVRHGQPAAEPLADVDAGQSLGDHLAGQEVALDELAEAAPDLVLAPGDDRRVRDGQAERVAEQRGDGEPVGQRADHRRLGAGPDVADPRRPVVLVASRRRGRRRRRTPAGRWRRPSSGAGPADAPRQPATITGADTARSYPRPPIEPGPSAGDGSAGELGGRLGGVQRSTRGRSRRTSVNSTAPPMARPDESGTRTGSSVLALGGGSDIHVLTMIRR